MKLLKLKLKNFKGIKSLELVANGEDLRIFGDNATGKTTILDAFTWLLFDKDSQNRADFAIKTLNKDGEPLHHLDHEVEGIFEIDGETIELKKIYREKWTKKRGTANEFFSGHETDYYINGVPTKKSEYTQRVAEIAPEDRFKLLTSPLYFNEFMKWQDRRELLIEIAGDVTMEDVIAANPDLKELPTILGKHSPDDYKAIVMARRAKVNKELERIPIRIDEAERNLPRIDDIANPDALPDDIEKLRAELRKKQEELAQAKAGGQVAEKTKELRMIEAQIVDLKNKHRQSLDEKVGNKSRELSYAQSEIYKLKANINAKSDTIKYNETSIKSLDEKMEKLRNEWHEENAKVFEQEQAAFLKLDTCPTCGQPLPQDRLQEARDKAMAQFNKAKAEKLEAISAEGKKLKDMKAAMEENLAYVRCELEKATAELAGLEKKEAALKAEINDIMQGEQPVESTPEYVRLQKQHEELQEQIRQAQADVSTTVAAIQKEADEISGAIQALELAQARFDARESGLRRIEELKAEERKLAAEYEELERQLYLTEEFIRTKVRLLEDRINSKFCLAEFKLFETQINGGINPICETTYKGVPWGSLNSAGKVQVGLDIIRTLQEHYQFRPPVWIDNRESIVELPKLDCQVISLIVSEKDKTLRIEGATQDAATLERQMDLFEEAI